MGKDRGSWARHIGARALGACLSVAAALLLGGGEARAQTLSEVCGSPFTFDSPPAGGGGQTLLLSPDQSHLFVGSPDTSITVLVWHVAAVGVLVAIAGKQGDWIFNWKSLP